jgi:hypothetical protein
MRTPVRKVTRVPRQYHGRRVQIQTPVRPREAFEKPAPEEAGAACDEYAFASQFPPELRRMVQDVVEIGCQRVHA